MTMATVSTGLFSIGVILVALGFAAHVGHAVLLANGRRLAPLATAPGRQPALAGVVTGSFAEERTRPTRRAPTLRRRPRWPAAVGLTSSAFLALVGSLLLRGLVVGRGPWGNMFEFTVAFWFSILGGYLFLQRRYPIRSIGFIPTGIALALLLYASSLPSAITSSSRRSRTRRC